MGRKRASSSVSLSPSPSVERKFAVVSDPEESSTQIPPLGTIVKGTVKATIQFGAFVTVPHFMDGLVHNTRQGDSLRKGQNIFAKVVLVSPTKYALDMRFVDQKTGVDEDPKNTERIKLEPAIALGKFTDYLIPSPRSEEKDSGDVRRNGVYKATIFKKLSYGYFVSLEGAIHRGLLPMGKAVGELNVGDPIFLKVVEIITRAKFNCDMRYVDQKSGKDLDPSHKYSSERLGGSRDEQSVSRRRDSPSPIRRRTREVENDGRRDSPANRRKRERYESPIKRAILKTNTKDRSESPIKRKRDRSESPIKRKRDRSESPIKRKRDRSESPIKRKRDRSESSVVVRRTRRSRSRSEEVIRRRR